MGLVADAGRYCWRAKDGWYLRLWEVAPLPEHGWVAPWPPPVLREYGPYPTQGAALAAFWALGAQWGRGA